MHSSQTWQELPKWLLAPLMDQVLTQAEASEMFDCWLMTPEGETRLLPDHLHQAAERMFLWEMEVQARVQ